MQLDPLALDSGLSITDLEYDAVVVGAGVAGLSFTLRLPAEWRVALLTKGVLGESNTRYAQGGISAAIGEGDSPSLHGEDTLSAGAGLSDAPAVEELVSSAPEAVDWLLSLGTEFDRDPATGAIELGREAAHSRHRVLHAGGDATGAEVERSLVEAVRTRRNVDLFDHAFGLDLIVEQGECSGLTAALPGYDGLVALHAPIVVIAAGGAGQLWAVTSNPAGATGDGLAMAIRAGVAIADPEFVQFHPTVLTTPGGEPFLVTEAVRGEGAFLRDLAGERFMVGQHELAELAPRDVVARGIQAAMAVQNTDHIFLDLSHLDYAAMHRRFPTIAAELKRRGLDLGTDLIPVAPAAHYFIGGLASGPTGLTSLPGLLSLGEAACSGVHGANRLASNSLLEGLVFGTNAAEEVIARQRGSKLLPQSSHVRTSGVPAVYQAVRDGSLLDAIRDLQQTMSAHVAVVRNAAGLLIALEILRRIDDHLASDSPATIAAWEARNMALSAQAVASAALHREESRGAHFRADFPETNTSLTGLDSLLDRVPFSDWRYGRIPSVITDSSRSAPIDSASATS